MEKHYHKLGIREVILRLWTKLLREVKTIPGILLLVTMNYVSWYIVLYCILYLSIP